MGLPETGLAWAKAPLTELPADASGQERRLAVRSDRVSAIHRLLQLAGEAHAYQVYKSSHQINVLLLYVFNEPNFQ